ncbi:DUF1353 domain-containing protein [Chitinivorax sp. B]|uniref:DUF1353 domain-containing protein n=1 Tax=Chitinivorax sp. B TaxID=2502235 RepID=UPI0010F80728|nr:DUF1353 domain-containing protein [Chitinivorax sp. B]
MLAKQPQLSPWPEAEHYRLLADYEIDTPFGLVNIPSHFHYDGASVPALAWQVTYTPFHPDVMAPALVHDWLYYTHHIAGHAISRDNADDTLEDLLRRNGVGSAKRRMMIAAVKLAGGAVWDNNEEDRMVLKNVFGALTNDGLTPQHIKTYYGLDAGML